MYFLCCTDYILLFLLFCSFSSNICFFKIWRWSSPSDSKEKNITMYAVKPWGHAALIGGTIESYCLGIGMRWRESTCTIIERESSPLFRPVDATRCTVTQHTIKLLCDLGCNELQLRSALFPSKGWRILTSDLKLVRWSSHFPGSPTGEPSFHCLKGDLLQILRSEFQKYGGSIEWGITNTNAIHSPEGHILLEKTYGSTSDLEAVIDTTPVALSSSIEQAPDLRITRGCVAGDAHLIANLFDGSSDVCIIMGSGAAAHCWVLPNKLISWKITQQLDGQGNTKEVHGIFSDLLKNSSSTETWTFSSAQLSQESSLRKCAGRMCVLGDGLIPVDIFEFRGDSAQEMVSEAAALCTELYGMKYHRGNVGHIFSKFSLNAFTRRRFLCFRDLDDLQYFSNPQSRTSLENHSLHDPLLSMEQ